LCFKVALKGYHRLVGIGKSVDVEDMSGVLLEDDATSFDE
jgi:hypothetical protein